MTMPIHRRSLLQGAAAAILFAPHIARAAADLTSLHAAAQKEGAVTWYTSHYNAETAERIRKAFMETYPGIEVNLLRATTQVAFQRLSQELASGTVQCDVFGTSDIGHFIQLKANGQLEQYQPAMAETMLDVYRDIDPEGFFHATSAGVITITYNSSKVIEADVPKSWADFVDPKWNGQLSVGHPGYSGYVGTWAVVMFKLHGEEFFKKLTATNPQVGRSIQDTVTTLVSGERSVAGGNIASTLASAEKGNALAISYPSDGVVLIDSPSAIIKGTKNPNASKLMMEFLCSPIVSEIMVKEFGETMHTSVAPNPKAKALDQIASNHLSVAEITEGIPKVVELWRNVFGV